jgi:hypothetical protein
MLPVPLVPIKTIKYEAVAGAVAVREIRVLVAQEKAPPRLVDIKTEAAVYQFIVKR